MNLIYFKELITDHFPNLDSRIFDRDFNDPTFGAGMPDEFENVYEQMSLNDLLPIHATVLVLSNQNKTSHTAPTQLAICAAPAPAPVQPQPTQENRGGSNETSDTAAPLLAICAPTIDELHGNPTNTNATPTPRNEPEVDFASAAAAVQSSLSQSNNGKDVFNDFDIGSSGGVDESTPVNSQEKPKETLSASPIVSSKL